MKCTKLLSKPSRAFGRSMRCTKLAMDDMYEIGRKISKPNTDYYVAPLHYWPHDLVVCVVGLLPSLNINTQEFALSQL